MAPATVHITGSTFRYTSFDGARAPIAGVSVAASATINGSPFAMTTSAVDGTYDLAIATSGTPQRVAVRYVSNAEWVTNVVFDRPIDRDLAGPNGDVLTLGDAPIWSSGTMDSILSTAGLAQNAARGFLNISVRDCLGAPIAGAVVDIQPMPEAIVYQADDGIPRVALTETQPRYGAVFGMNAMGGATLITLTHPTRTFQPFSIDVPAGNFNTLVVGRTTD